MYMFVLCKVLNNVIYCNMSSKFDEIVRDINPNLVKGSIYADTLYLDLILFLVILYLYTGFSSVDAVLLVYNRTCIVN